MSCSQYKDPVSGMEYLLTEENIKKYLFKLYMKYVKESADCWKDKNPESEIAPTYTHSSYAKNIMLNQHGIERYNGLRWVVVDKDKFFVTMMTMEI